MGFRYAKGIFDKGQGDKDHHVYPKLLSGMAHVLERDNKLDEAANLYGEVRTIKKHALESCFEVYDVYDNQCARDYAVVLDELASVLTRKGDDGSLGLALELHQEILSLKEKGLQDE